MVCFVIELVLPLSKKPSNDVVIQRRFEHLIHHLNAESEKIKETDELRHYIVRLCDEDAITLLRDMPLPFNVVSILIQRTGEFLYQHRRHHSPPQIPLYKSVYWLAKSTERWKLTESAQL